MAKGNFPNCNAFTRKEEGGYANHPSDPGGKTMNGITEKVFLAWLDKHGKKKRPVRTITHEETDAIYKEEYWNPAGCENLFAGVDLAVYDASVNSGVSRGLKWLKSSVGSNDHSVTVKRICATRLSFVKSLTTWKTFGNGWSKRIARVEATGVRWALSAMGLSANTVSAKLVDESKKAGTASKAQGSAAVGSGAAGAATPAGVSPDQVAQWVPDAGTQTGSIVLIGVVVAIGVLTLYLVLKARNNDNRSKAYAEEASK